MQSDAWIDLLQKVPPDYHDKVLLVTSVGLEISLQSILRMEEKYAVIRGRLAGTTDSGRVFFIPYGQISFLCMQKPMKAAELRAMYGEPPRQEEEEALLTERSAGPAQDLEKTQPLPALAEPQAPATVTPPRFTKAELLARLRSRSNSSADSQPPSDQ